MTSVQRSLAGRRALVTAATKRLGRAVAEGLARAGADVAIHYRGDAAGAAETVGALAALGVTAVDVQGDLSDAATCARVVAEAEQRLGGLHLLVNNAAMFRRTPVDRMDADDFDEHVRSNARSVYLMSLEAGLGMKARGHGAIVNIADVAGLRPWAGFVPYSASKGAVVNLTRGFAQALAPEVRVNAIAPGPMLPPAGEPREQGEAAVKKTLLGRWGSPDDIASAVLFLATSPYVTGVVLPVDGGRSVTM